MATWADFYPELMPHVVGCPNPMANTALREAARDFFRRTRLWRQWMDAVTVVNGVRVYDLDLPTGSMVARIERCTVNGQPMDVLSHTEQESDYSLYEQHDLGVVSVDRASFVLTRPLGDGALIGVEVSLIPNKTGRGIPDDLFAQHSQDIVEGAKHRLMLIPKTAFYDSSLAMNALTNYESAVGTKTVEAWKGSTGTVPRRRIGWC